MCAEGYLMKWLITGRGSQMLLETALIVCVCVFTFRTPFFLWSLITASRVRYLILDVTAFHIFIFSPPLFSQIVPCIPESVRAKQYQCLLEIWVCQFHARQAPDRQDMGQWSYWMKICHRGRYLWGCLLLDLIQTRAVTALDLCGEAFEYSVCSFCVCVCLCVRLCVRCFSGWVKTDIMTSTYARFQLHNFTG